MTTLDDLRALHALLSKPGAHIADNFAVDRSGAEVSPLNENACRWCTVGGIERVTNLDDGRKHELAALLCRYLPDDVALQDGEIGTLIQMNDTRFGEILPMIARAIAGEEKGRAA